jgi:hypothetical protein
MAMPRALQQSAKNSDHAVGGHADVGYGGADPKRLAGQPGHIGNAAHHLSHLVERRPVGIRPLQKSIDRAVDDPRIDLRNRFVIHSQPVQNPRRVVVKDNVGD